MTYVGEGEAARLVKIFHNLLLGIYTQSLAEILVLAERGGVQAGSGHGVHQQLCDGLASSASTRTRPWSTLTSIPPSPRCCSVRTLTSGSLRLASIRCPCRSPVSPGDIVESSIGRGFAKDDFATLLLVAAGNAGVDLKSEDADVTDGLDPE